MTTSFVQELHAALRAYKKAHQGRAPLRIECSYPRHLEYVARCDAAGCPPGDFYEFQGVPLAPVVPMTAPSGFVLVDTPKIEPAGR